MRSSPMSHYRLNNLFYQSWRSISSSCASVTQRRSMAISCATDPTEGDFAESPYRIGNFLDIRKHVPPTSVKSKSVYCYMKRPEYVTLMAERELSLKERYHRHPPTETEPVGTKKFPLEIVKHVRAGPEKAAQLILAKVKDINDKPLVAKFYDPFYYDLTQDDVDPFRAVDEAYIKENLAYQYLKGAQGSLIPRHVGSFSCEFPLGAGSRAVRLILIEYVEGTCMDTVDPYCLSQAARQNIMEKVVRTESYLYARKFDHRDNYPRNIIIRSKDLMHFANKDIDVVLVDLESSDFGWEIKKPDFDNAISPIIRWHERTDRMDPFRVTGWIDWEWQPWLERCFRGDPNFEPVTEAQRRAWLR